MADFDILVDYGGYISVEAFYFLKYYPLTRFTFENLTYCAHKSERDE